MTWYNTTAEAPNQLDIFQQRAEKQEAIVLQLFEAHKELSPWKAFKLCRQLGRDFPITSIRRAISDLEKQGKLVKTSKQVKGPYGVNEYLWRAA
ncbi:MAG TPA: hypothetical protein VD907_06820 [Verrucomicrobiae bacterium]|nr:hypothetical protein [Verrucomicrobiae bacterium]